MNPTRRWDRCVSHRGNEALGFIAEYFGEAGRCVLLIAGAGFDPRATAVCERLVSTGAKVRGLFIREERLNRSLDLSERAGHHADRLAALVPNHMLAPLAVFAPDGAVVGGRNAVGVIQEHLALLDGATDIVIDISALSIGVAFPIVRHMLALAARPESSFNLHLMVTDEPATDQAIASTACDRVDTVHGFRGAFGLESTARAARLWLPQLVQGERAVLERIRAAVDPHDICPILPFPASQPRAADELIDHYREEFSSVWNVDASGIVYADERNPLDLYRTILRIADKRARVFAEVGGSLVVLTPKGSKVLSIGALMAAIERDFPVAHVEASSHSVNLDALDRRRTSHGEVVHVWLYGEAYAALACIGGQGA